MTVCHSLATLVSRSDARRHATRLVVAASATLVLMLPSPAHAQTASVCGPEVKAEVAKALSAVAGASDTEKLSLEAELYAKYQFCAQDSQVVSSTFVAAARQCGATVSNLGSTFYEEMSCAGYDPQRRQFAAPIRDQADVRLRRGAAAGQPRARAALRRRPGRRPAPGRTRQRPPRRCDRQPAPDLAVRGDHQREHQPAVDSADEQHHAQGSLDPVVGVHADQLRLRSDLGQRAELQNPPRPVSRCGRGSHPTAPSSHRSCGDTVRSLSSSC